jgi:hypothetical protein
MRKKTSIFDYRWFLFKRQEEGACELSSLSLDIIEHDASDSVTDNPEALR